MNPTGIVDTHVHFIDPRRFRYPWLARRKDVDRLFLEDDYLAAKGITEIASVVLVEAATQDVDALPEAAWLAEAAARSPLVGAVVAQARLERGPAVRDELDRLADLPGVTGTRRVVRAPFQSDPDFCVRPDFIAGVRLLAEYRLAFEVACGPVDLANVTKLADGCPDTVLVVNHMANPPLDASGFDIWKAGIDALARRPNVACKLSGLQTHLPQDWDAATVAPYTETVAAAFGAKRILFGSDTPVQIIGGGFPPWIAALEAIFGQAGDEERELFFRGNAQRIYRIE